MQKAKKFKENVLLKTKSLFEFNFQCFYHCKQAKIRKSGSIHCSQIHMNYVYHVESDL